MRTELEELIRIFNSISLKVDVPEISDWISNLNQSSEFGLFRRDYISKARILLTKVLHEDISEKSLLIDFINRLKLENYDLPL